MASRITTEIVKLGPAEAADLLAKNKMNRKLSKANVTKHAKAMTDGLWLFDGAPIRISAKGVLMDGQHRLNAVVESGTTQPFVVIRGLAEDAMASMDTGAKRNLQDLLEIKGETLYSNFVSGLITIAWRFEQGARGSGLYAGTAKGVSSPQSSTLLAYFNKNKTEIIDAVKVGEKVRRTVPTAPRTIMLAAFLFNRIDPNDAKFFFERLADGVSLPANSPILLLRNKLIELNNTKHQKRTLDHIALAFYIKAWNAYRNGVTLGSLRFASGGATPEKFPEAI